MLSLALSVADWQRWSLEWQAMADTMAGSIWECSYGICGQRNNHDHGERIQTWKRMDQPSQWHCKTSLHFYNTCLFMYKMCTVYR